MNLFGMTYQQLEEEFIHRYGRGGFHASALYRMFYQSTRFDLKALPAFRKSSQLRKQVQRDLKLDQPTIVRQFVEEGVIKLVLRLKDGLTIETVVVPMANHATVCISAQVGCRMGCRFCHTAKIGLRRNLTAAEMVAQVYTVRLRLGVAVRNVVFMGMGEPLDNYDQVIHAIEVMEDQRGLDIAKRHITVSTVGLPHAIDKLGLLNWNRLRLALSLNAPNDRLRSHLMPINQRYGLQTLRSALGRYPRHKGDTVLIEYVLIRGVNDRLQHARQLARFLEGLPVKINLIACNPNGDGAFQAPGEQQMNRFHQALIELHQFVRVRSSKGSSIRAACGQLGGV